MLVISRSRICGVRGPPDAVAAVNAFCTRLLANCGFWLYRRRSSILLSPWLKCWGPPRSVLAELGFPQVAGHLLEADDKLCRGLAHHLGRGEPRSVRTDGGGVLAARALGHREKGVDELLHHESVVLRHGLDCLPASRGLRLLQLLGDAEAF